MVDTVALDVQVGHSLGFFGTSTPTTMDGRCALELCRTVCSLRSALNCFREGYGRFAASKRWLELHGLLARSVKEQR
jgi:hypothetical protein